MVPEFIAEDATEPTVAIDMSELPAAVSPSSVLLTLRMELTRDRDGKIVHLSVHGFPVEWPAWRVIDDARGAIEQGTANVIDRAIVEAVDAGHCQFPSSTGGPEWRLFVDND